MPPDLRAAVQAVLLPPEYAVLAEPGAPRWTARNAAHGMRATFSGPSVDIGKLDDPDAPPLLTLELVGWGRPGDLRAPQPAQIVAEGARIEYRRGPLVEWYLNGLQGLEQGFTIETAPRFGEASEQLELRLALGGALTPQLLPDGDGLLLGDKQGVARLSYAQLAAWDADGRPLHARLELADAAVSIVIETDGAAFPLTVDPLIAAEEAKLDPEGIGMFGNSVAVFGDLAVVGKFRDTIAGFDSGSAHVFARTPTLGWIKLATLTAPDAAAGDQFGTAVALYNDGGLGETIVVVGAPTDDHDGGVDAGSAYVFVGLGPTWSSQGKLTASDAASGDFFGGSVSVFQDSLMVGAFQAGPSSGSAYVFEDFGSGWFETAKLTAPDADAGDEFGAAVAIQLDTAVVGARGDASDSLNFLEGSAYVFRNNGAGWDQEAKLTASDAASGDLFGISVALWADTLLVGARGSNFFPGGSDAGAAYAFVRQGTTWSPQGKLTAIDGAENDQFGQSVALFGDTAIIGAPHNPFDGSSDPGSAYVFKRFGTNWAQWAKLSASDAMPYDNYGLDVAVFGQTVVVGAWFDDVAGEALAGSARVIELGVSSWSEEATLTALNVEPLDHFGSSVAIASNTAIIGVPFDENLDTGSGSAWVFVSIGSSWSPQARLTAFDGTGLVGFGADVAVAGNTALVGAPFADGMGAAYVFVRTGTSWSVQDKLTAIDAATGDQFGGAVALENNTAVVGARLDDNAGGTDAGSAYVFVRNGTSWNPQGKLTAIDAAPDDQLGIAVAVSGDTAIVGADHDDVAGSNSGSAYVFVRNGASWSPQDKLTASDAEALDRFGNAVAMAGDTALVGAPGEDELGFDPGTVYVFAREGTLWSEQDTLTASDGVTGDGFGAAVALSGDRAVVGAAGDTHSGSIDTGSAYVFVRSAATWNEMLPKLKASDAGTGDHFGTDVAISNDIVLVGSPEDDSFGGVDAGSVYGYQLIDTPWTDLGFGLAGAGGVPLLVGTGTLLPGSGGTLALSNAAPSARTTLFVSLSSTPAPFKGGTLVPVPVGWNLPGYTSGLGVITMPFHMTIGIPSGTQFHYQYAVVDFGAVQGVALSNALRADVP